MSDVPAPDREHIPCYQFGEVVDIIYSEDGSHRAVVTGDEHGLFRIHLEWWDTAYLEESGLAQWSPLGCTSMTDSAASARVLAVEALRE
jgi:hypothetical protein